MVKKIIDYDFFPLRHDFFAHYKVKAIRKEFGNDGVHGMLVIWSFLQEKGGFIDPSNSALIEDIAETRAFVSSKLLLSYCLAMASSLLDLLKVDEKGRYYNEEILVRLGKMKEIRASYAERGAKGGTVSGESRKAKKEAIASTERSNSLAIAKQQPSNSEATRSRVEESRELPLGNSNTILSTANLSLGDTKSDLAPPAGGSVLHWSPETKIADFISAGFGLSHTDLGKATKQYDSLSNEIKKVAFEKSVDYLKTYRDKYPNQEPSLTAYFQLEIWKR